jgi:hypothetical protein
MMKRTPISDLPDLDDLENSNKREEYNSITSIIPQEQMKYARNIRNYTRSPDEMSGMNPGNMNEPYMNNNKQILMNAYNNLPINRENYYYNQGDMIPRNMNQQYGRQQLPSYINPSMQEDFILENKEEEILDMEFDDNKNKYKKRRKDNLNCRDLSFHIMDCPICSKIYNNDKTIYIIIIVLLLCIILILGQKLLQFYCR